MNDHINTIAAIATATTQSGIGIIRVSGDQAISIVNEIFQSKRTNFSLLQAFTHTIHYGQIVDGKRVLDEVLVSVMRAPHSYTAEDTVEINCHGGIFVMRKILELVIRHGARPAQPGEFTKRAFLNGRMDLSQAEAVKDIICSKNEYAMESSVRQLSGTLSDAIRTLREKILYQSAYIESALDDPEHYSLDDYGCQMMNMLIPTIEEIRNMACTYENGRILSEGIRTVILGKPNVGKSSLMNVLVGEDRAIVTDIAGTTRDILEEQINLNGISLIMIDTAGIHETEDTVEKIGISRAKKAAEQADLIIYVVDGSEPLNEDDEAIISLLKNKRTIVLLNKSDLEMAVTSEQLAEKIDHPILSVSAKERTGIDQLEQEILRLFDNRKLKFNDEIVITNVRHKYLLDQAVESLERVVCGIRQGDPEVFWTVDLMDAYQGLGHIIGEEIEDDLIDEIFGKFCMGK